MEGRTAVIDNCYVNGTGSVSFADGGRGWVDNKRLIFSMGECGIFLEAGGYHVKKLFENSVSPLAQEQDLLVD
jgi:hypothetical protein